MSKYKIKITKYLLSCYKTKMKFFKIICLVFMLLLLVIALISYEVAEDIPLDETVRDTYVKYNTDNDKDSKIQKTLSYHVGSLYLSLGNQMNFELRSIIDESVKLRGEIGMNLPEELGHPTFCKDSLHCLDWKTEVKLMIKQTSRKCHVFIWKSIIDEPLMDCFNYGNDNWFGGPVNSFQYWPIEELNIDAQPYISQDFQFMSIAERYWLTSSGLYIYVDETVPLFIDTSFYSGNSICFIAKDAPPYLPRDNIRLKYTVCQFDNPKTAHEHAIKNVLRTPSDIPDIQMIKHPIWSTWVKFQQNVTANSVINFANDIIMYGFNHSQIEIDDNWEICYGSKEFNVTKFPDVTMLMRKLKEMNFRITLWTHPFVNTDCYMHKRLAQKGYFVKNHRGYIKTKWWNGEASIIDFTNDEAVHWFKEIHLNLINKTGIDGFKFDAGETSWLPQVPILNGTYISQPQIYTKAFVETAAEFGKISEVRVGHKTQNLPLFVRMLDKDSIWTFENGLQSLISTLLVLNMVGYNWVLPDMVGGNGYTTPITKELFIRWLQANTFMPTIQFSAAPFDYDKETIEISKKFTSLHYSYSEKIIELMRNTVKTGAPLNPPIWWIDPCNPTAHGINSEFLLGEDILIAPILEENAIQRDIYLPKGIWRDENNPSRLYSGRNWLRNYPADITKLPYFTRINATMAVPKYKTKIIADDEYGFQDGEIFF
ncbi:myogenesis-regulating glycosidase-like [Lycorma delicatula]|uniref:myogenesis-regulating glycosidase-like n=1 Tax=Lycorma delicatula TaxID=130591 RepID=UPI003F5141F8